ncbi:hypothetical protein YC2023_110930 [Brassica napus]
MARLLHTKADPKKMSSSQNNSTSSSSTQSSLPAGATTGENNVSREATAITSTQQLRAILETDTVKCGMCGKYHTIKQNPHPHRRGHNNNPRGRK